MRCFSPCPYRRLSAFPSASSPCDGTRPSTGGHGSLRALPNFHGETQLAQQAGSSWAGIAPNPLSPRHFALSSSHRADPTRRRHAHHRHAPPPPCIAMALERKRRERRRRRRSAIDAAKPCTTSDERKRLEAPFAAARLRLSAARCHRRRGGRSTHYAGSAPTSHARGEDAGG